jgi:hypothetical protein
MIWLLVYLDIRSRSEANPEFWLFPEKERSVLFQPSLATRVKIDVKVPYQFSKDQAHLGVGQTEAG